LDTGHIAVQPPSVVIAAPLMFTAAGEHKNATNSAISAGSALRDARPNEIAASRSITQGEGAPRAFVDRFVVTPAGQTALHRTPR